MEADGIAAEVIFPNTVPPFYPSGVISAAAPTSPEDYRRRWAGLRAHNRWLVDFCAQAPGRRAGIAQVFLDDVDDAISEVRWARNAGLAGVLIPVRSHQQAGRSVRTATRPVLGDLCRTGDAGAPTRDCRRLSRERRERSGRTGHRSVRIVDLRATRTVPPGLRGGVREASRLAVCLHRDAVPMGSRRTGEDRSRHPQGTLQGRRPLSLLSPSRRGTCTLAGGVLHGVSAMSAPRE